MFQSLFPFLSFTWRKYIAEYMTIFNIQLQDHGNSQKSEAPPGSKIIVIFFSFTPLNNHFLSTIQQNISAITMPNLSPESNSYSTGKTREIIWCWLHFFSPGHFFICPELSVQSEQHAGSSRQLAVRNSSQLPLRAPAATWMEK